MTLDLLGLNRGMNVNILENFDTNVGILENVGIKILTNATR
jgi:hypothetical protein